MLLDFESQCFITRWENIKRGNLAGVVQLKVTAWKIKFKNQLSKNNNLELFWNFCFVGYHCFKKTVEKKIAQVRKWNCLRHATATVRMPPSLGRVINITNMKNRSNLCSFSTLAGRIRSAHNIYRIPPHGYGKNIHFSLHCPFKRHG